MIQFLVKQSPYIVWLPFIIGTFKIKSLSKERWFLYFAIVLGIVGENSMRYADEIWSNNMPIVHLYTLFEFFLLFSVFHYGKKGIISNQVYKRIIFGFTFLGVVNMIFIQGIWNENSISRSLEGLILIICALIFFYQILQELHVLRPERSFMFWYSLAILIYFTGNLLLFIYSNHLLDITRNSPEDIAFVKKVWILNYILNIILYVLYTVAFLCKEQKPIPESSLSVP